MAPQADVNEKEKIKCLRLNNMLKDPIAAGLEAISTGFALRFPDDEENISYQFEVYDALYAWCRLQIASE